MHSLYTNRADSPADQNSKYERRLRFLLFAQFCTAYTAMSHNCLLQNAASRCYYENQLESSLIESGNDAKFVDETQLLLLARPIL